MGVSVPLQRLWQGLRDTWDAEPEESPPLLRPGQLDPSPALADALQPKQDQPPQLAASGINLSCGTVGVIPAAQGVRGNSSDLCPRALLGIPAEQGLWHFTDCNELLLLHWFFAPPKDATIHILGNMGPSVAFPGTGGNTLPQALRQTGKLVNSWASSYCVAFRSTSASLHPHSQQGKSKDMTAKKYGPQTPSIHPLQSW